MINGNPEYDFFEQNPEYRYTSLCQEVIEKEGEAASRIMWLVYLSEDPRSSYYRIPIVERRQELATNYLKDPDFDWGKIKYAIDAYPRMTMTKEQVLFKIWADKLDMMTAKLKDFKLDDDGEFNKSLRIMERMDKIWTGYDKIKTKMVDAETKGKLHGGGMESRRESRKTRTKKKNRENSNQ